jgi:glycosyltransferase involved in cell wall biosynthesis
MPSTVTKQGVPDIEVSVVVPARDAAATIVDQLNALGAQNFAGTWEVIVVDDGSHDGTAEVAERMADRVPLLTVLSSERSRGSSHARNTGTRAARGRLIAYCDADDLVSDRWLAGLVSALSTSTLVTGPIDLSMFNPYRVYAWRRPLRRLQLPWRGYLIPVIGCNMAVRRETFDLVGGFDEVLATCEDWDFAFRIQLAGGTLGFDPHAVVHRRLRQGWGYFRRQFDYGVGHVGLYCRFRDKGLRRDVLSGAARLGGALLGAPLALIPKYRYHWMTVAGEELGRIKGSVVARTFFI